MSAETPDFPEIFVNSRDKRFIPIGNNKGRLPFDVDKENFAAAKKVCEACPLKRYKDAGRGQLPACTGVISVGIVPQAVLYFAMKDVEQVLETAGCRGRLRPEMFEEPKRRIVHRGRWQR